MVFSELPSNETGRCFINNEDNLNKMNIVIEEGIMREEKLRKIITDAVQVKCTLTHAMNPNLSESEFLQFCSQPESDWSGLEPD